MKNRPCILASLLVALAPICAEADTSKTPYDGSWESLQEMPVPAWFDDGKIGIFIHWGPYSVIGYRKGGRGYSEHVPKLFYTDSKHYYPYMKKRWGATPPEFGYKDIIPEFKAEKWDPDAWAQLFAEVGAKYVVMTAEHHDGWANWDSDLTPWNAVDKGPKRDLVGDLGTALKKRGLKYAPSYHRERHQSFFTKKQYVVDAVPQDDISEEIKRVPEAASLYGPFGTSKQFVDDYVARWKEIQTKYQPDFLWMDDFPIYTRDGNNVRGGKAKPEVRYFDDQVRLMITDFMNDGAARGAEVYLNNKGANRNWPDGVGCLEKDNLKLKVIGPKWQSCTTFGTSFGYLANDKYKSVESIIHEMVEVISRNGNFLINIGPKADGTIPEPQVERLIAMGAWLKINGDAIYGSRYWKVSEQKDEALAFTTKGTKLYAIKLTPPGSPFTITGTAGWSENQVHGVRLLGCDAKVSWLMTPKGLRIIPPPNPGASQHAWSFEIRTDREQHHPNVIVDDASSALKGTKAVDLEGNSERKRRGPSK
ncbi:alpha-L-fucosidase [Haloferula rosea]|uniref:alpha-L-fucosidase n=1 Tax=Haloferula rosea TaxID=490093 RepID=A0A934R793_9BACT|nr:alpha-L-fucosidase [Haloferula rosea]MBK1825532.1 alpha-L-fucosidase [Haloferula rosea]